jgi:DNA-binding HxlR family transcriptional regulator
VIYSEYYKICSTQAFLQEIMKNTKETVENQDNDDLLHGIKVIGDAWTLTIVNALSEATHRFNELQRAIDISPTTLADRLKRLENWGMVTQQKQTVDQLSVIYELTEKGKKSIPVLREIEKFAQKFLQDD